MASALNSLLGSSPSSGTAGSSGSGAPAPSEEVFLQLLVSQIKNQDPLNPTDSTQFVSQLAQFSELEQVIGIRSDIESAMSSNAQQNATNPTTPTSTPAASANTAGNPVISTSSASTSGISTI